MLLLILKKIKMKSKYFSALLFIGALTFVFTFSSKAQNTNEQSNNVPQGQTFQTIKLKVSGITCSGDSKDIEKEVTKLNGVTSCMAKGKASATSVFEITFDPAKVSEQEIRKQVEDTPGCTDPNDRPYKVKKG